MNTFLNFISNKNFIWSSVVVIICIVFYIFAHRIIDRMLMKHKDNISKKGLSYVRRLRSLARLILLLIAVLIILHINGINIGSMLAGVGIASIISGLAFQDVFRDIIASFNLVIDKFFVLGDVVKIGDFEGEVIEMQMKTTKFRDIYNGNILTLSNRNINEAIVISKQADIDVPLPYELKIEKAKKVLEDALSKISELERIDKTIYCGVQNYDTSAMIYRVRFFADPKYLPDLKRKARAIIKDELDKNNLSIPYQKIALIK